MNTMTDNLPPFQHHLQNFLDCLPGSEKQEITEAIQVYARAAFLAASPAQPEQAAQPMGCQNAMCQPYRDATGELVLPLCKCPAAAPQLKD